MLSVRRAVSLLFGMVALMALVACGGKEIPMVDIGATDYAFEVPEEIEGGVARLRLENSGAEAHHAQLVRLNDGVTFDQFQSAMAENLPTGNLGPLFAMVTFEGGPASVSPGDSAEAVLDLEQGNYALLCFVESPDGVPHLAKGMVRAFSVTAPEGDQPDGPDASAQIALSDFSFGGVPSTVEAGTVTWEINNNGQEPHEMAVLQLTGVSAEEFPQAVQAMFSGEAPMEGPPPFEDAGGLQAIMPGSGGWATLELEEGDYALICFVPSPANQGAPHAALGMVSTFTVE